MYIWQQPDWPRFRWDENRLRPKVNAARLLQGRLLGHAEAAPESGDVDLEMDALLQNAIRTSEIEGEKLDVASVRSSVARQLGLERAGLPGRVTPESESLVELLLEATHKSHEGLSIERLCRWKAMLFPQGASALNPIRIGQLRGEQTMQVVSGRIDIPTVHFEAPPRDCLESELSSFTDWFNQPPPALDPLLRAGIAHLWLITIHPFDDGNGRVTRAVTDRALAQAERQSVRFYSLSEAIMARRTAYYQELENAQRGKLDITDWLHWFIDTLEAAMDQAMERLDRVLTKAHFWQRHAATALSERQIKAINRLLDAADTDLPQGINARKYQSMARVSKATATRDLTDLLDKGCLQKLPGGGRSTRYAIALNRRTGGGGKR